MSFPRSPSRQGSNSVNMREVRDQLSIPGTYSQQSVAKQAVEDQQSVGSIRSRRLGEIKSFSYNRSVSANNCSSRSLQRGPGSSRAGWLLKKKSSQHLNNQIVADFFDVQSLASEPTVAGTRRKPARHGSVKQLETHSVCSKRSVGSAFMGFFFRMKDIVNDEVDVVNEYEVDGRDEPDINDEELTLGSGFNSDSEDGSMYDDMTEAGVESIIVKETIQRIIAGNGIGTQKVKKKSIIGRILQKRKDRKAKKKAQKEAKAMEKVAMKEAMDRESSGVVTFHFQPDSRQLQSEGQFSVSDTNKSMNRSLPSKTTASSVVSAANGKENIGKPTQSLPTSEERKDKQSGSNSNGKINFDLPQEENLEQRPKMNRSSSQSSASCRWSCDASVDSSSSAPKPPVRRRDSEVDTGSPTTNKKETKPQETSPRKVIRRGDGSFRSAPLGAVTSPRPPRRNQSNHINIKVDINIDPQERAGIEVTPTERTLKMDQEKAWRENVKREMAFRSGKEESKEDFASYHDDNSDDESVLSILSGLLATWSAERDGFKVKDVVRLNGKPVKSILKGSGPDTRPRQNVVFDSIFIREYERTVGDNPSCSRGPPISIGWSYVLAHEYPIDDYELLIKTPKRSKKQFHLSADTRTHLLMQEWECTEEEIRKARREVTYIQYCRAKSSFGGARSAAAKEALLQKKQQQQQANGNNSANMMCPPSPSGKSVATSPRPPVNNARMSYSVNPNNNNNNNRSVPPSPRSAAPRRTIGKPPVAGNAPNVTRPSRRPISELPPSVNSAASSPRHQQTLLSV